MVEVLSIFRLIRVNLYVQKIIIHQKLSSTLQWDLAIWFWSRYFQKSWMEIMANCNLGHLCLDTSFLWDQRNWSHKKLPVRKHSLNVSSSNWNKCPGVLLTICEGVIFPGGSVISHLSFETVENQDQSSKYKNVAVISETSSLQNLTKSWRV